MPGTPVEEMELVTRAADGDPEAFAALVVRYQDRIYNLAYRMLGHADDAADVAQDTFLAAWEGLARFRGESALYTWLYRIAVNKALGRRRAASVSREYAVDGESSLLEVAADCSSAPEEVAEVRERAVVVQRAVSALEEDLRAVVVLKDVEGLEYEEIAEILAIPLGTVKSRLHRARLTLRGSLRRLLQVAP
ncbi:MAG: sigma-70 family RNA polymerase sigma factor [Planctomycetota bacterium]